jgi:hypothetical protein
MAKSRPATGPTNRWHGLLRPDKEEKICDGMMFDYRPPHILFCA